MNRDLVGVVGEWRTRMRDVGVETGGGDDSETGLVTEEGGKQQSMTGIDANLSRTTEIKRRATMTIYNYVCMQAGMHARTHARTHAHTYI